MIELEPEPLTAAAFQPFGEVIEAGEAYELINNGTAKKFANLATVDVSSRGGRTGISIFRATPYPLPLTIRMLERHPLGSQLFMPLHGVGFIAVVAVAGDKVDPSNVRAFVANGSQGVNY